MILAMAPIGCKLEIMRINGRDKQQAQLRSMGFVEGACVYVVSEMNGSLIVKIMGSRVALGRELALRVFTKPVYEPETDRSSETEGADAGGQNACFTPAHPRSACLNSPIPDS